MKWIGILLLFLSSGGMGLYASQRLQNDVRRTEKLIALTEECSAYIRYQQPELDELIDILSTNPTYQEFHFLQSISENSNPYLMPSTIWNDAIENDTAVPLPTREILESLGQVLGTTDIEGQLSALELHRIQLQQVLSGCRERYQKQGKLYQSLGILAGCMLGVLLW
ncbi:MAG: stage III sporulation protein AB [Oscillospiraceae bacterium]